MKVCAVIAEYNPFHLGHQYHLEMTRQKTKADVILVLMSGYYTQRGDMALISPRQRAKMALLSGADMVMSLPYTHTVRDAESYAALAVMALNRLECADTLSFGTEADQPELLIESASFMEKQKEAFELLLRKQLDKKLSYPKAVSAALAEARLYAPGTDEPNSILALSYLRALIRTGSAVKPVFVRRLGRYHDDGTGGSLHPSAGALRDALKRGDWASVKSGMPPEAYRILCRLILSGGHVFQDRIDLMTLNVLRNSNPQALLSLPDVREGIENRLLAAAEECRTVTCLTERCRGPHYTRARIQRLLCHCLLNTPSPLPETPEYLCLWGFTAKAVPLLKAIRRRMPVYDDYLSLEAAPEAKAEYKAVRMWYNCTDLPMSTPYREGMIVL